MKTPYGNQDATTSPTLQIIPREDHTISRQLFSDGALKVLYRLHNAGFEAYLVGGSLRDALLGKTPKDFDVATDATPEQLRDLFRNSRIIGRRFRIVHVRFGREIIEVTTFRGRPNDDHDEHQSQQSEHGLLLRDNVWGSIEEDARRRDFTINALYYNIADFSLHDWAGGLEDIEHRTLRLIGHPATRYREDPVRMLRAIRFAAKLDFTLAPATEAPIDELAPLLLQIPPARLFEEVLKLFLSGHALQTFHLLRHYGLFAMLFPEAEESMAELAWAEPLLQQALINTDARIQEGRPVTPAFLFGAMLWPGVQLRYKRLLDEGMPPIPAQQAAAQQAITRQSQHTAIPKRFGLPMRDIWDLQQRLPKRRGKRAFQTRAHTRFRAAYDFLLLREAAGETPTGLGAWWTAFQEGDEHAQQRLVGKLTAEATDKNKPGRRRPRKQRRDKTRNTPFPEP